MSSAEYTTSATAVHLPTQDPFSGDPLVVTRLENLATGTSFEGRFGLGWLSRLTTEQLDFVGLLLARRNNVQKLAADIGIAYNTARARFEEIVGAMGGPASDDERSATRSGQKPPLREVLERLASGEITPEEADRILGK